MNILRTLFRIVPVVIFAFNALNAASALDREIRHITPPQLKESNIKRKIVCHRPMRHGSPKMAIEIIEGKVVATNAGHGGSGWTLAPGAVKYMNTLIESSDYSTDLTKDTPITVIGAGVLGLFSAYDLIKRGYTNITVVAESFKNLTSHNAGGLVAPVSMDNTPAMQIAVAQMGIDSYNFFAEVSRGENADFPSQGAVVVPTYFETLEDSELTPYVEAGVMNPHKDVVLDFGNGTQRNMVAFDDGIFMNTAILMDSLNRFLSDKVTFKLAKVTSFAEIETRYVINCTGLGSAELLHDDEFVPVQGHLVMLQDQNPADLQYMILVYFPGITTNEHGQTVKRSFYIFPKQDLDAEASSIGVVGGTFIKGGTPATPNTEEFDNMVNAARRFYGI